MRKRVLQWFGDACGCLALTLAILAALAVPIGGLRADSSAAIDPTTDQCVSSCVSDGNSSDDCSGATSLTTSCATSIWYCPLTRPPSCPGWCLILTCYQQYNPTYNYYYCACSF